MALHRRLIALLLGGMLISCPVRADFEDNWFGDLNLCSEGIRRVGLTQERLALLLESFTHRLSTSDKTRRLELSDRFTKEMLRRVLSSDLWRQNDNILRTMIEEVLIATGHRALAADANKATLIYQCIHKWLQQEVLPLKPLHNDALWERRLRGAVTSKILETHELMLWSQQRGPYSHNSAVAAFVPLRLINRTRTVVSPFVRGPGGVEVPLHDIVRAMRDAGTFDPLVAPDVVPVPDPNNPGEFRFATFAHQPLVAARAAGIDVVLVKAHRPESFLPHGMNEQFTIRLMREDARIEFIDLSTGNRRREGPVFVPETWGDAVVCACITNRLLNGVTERDLPNNGAPGLPPYPNVYQPR